MSFFEEAAGGDKVTIAIRDLLCEYLGRHCGWLGSGLRSAGDFDRRRRNEERDIIIPHIESFVHKYGWAPWGKVQVRATELGNNAVLMEEFPLLTQNIPAHRRDLDVLRFSVADWRLHETRDEFFAACHFIAGTSQRANLSTNMGVGR